MNEFSLIEKYFAIDTAGGSIIKTTGDDCAEVAVPSGKTLAISVDTLVVDRHFSADDNPRGIGHKSLAVGLSDLAAQGATPAFCLLALTLPDTNEKWLEEFSAGFHSLAKQFGIKLIGGDTTQGALSISVTVGGYLPENQGLHRESAKVGDDIYVTGKIGLAALALKAIQQNLVPFAEWESRLHFPTPRTTFAENILPLANAAIDISDGLLADAAHIAKASGVSLNLELDLIPVAGQRVPGISVDDVLQATLCGGDDYELLFTASSENSAALMEIANKARLKLTKIGTVGKTGEQPVKLITGEWQPDKKLLAACLQKQGYKHFT